METGMRKLVRVMMIFGVLGLYGGLAPWSAAQADTAARTVQGKVVAVNLQSTPHIIVITVVLPSKQEMIVGATVGSDVAITKEKQAIGLSGIKTGQTVSLTYVKNQDGLTAKSIQVRK